MHKLNDFSLVVPLLAHVIWLLLCHIPWSLPHMCHRYIYCPIATPHGRVTLVEQELSTFRSTWVHSHICRVRLSQFLFFCIFVFAFVFVFVFVFCHCIVHDHIVVYSNADIIWMGWNFTHICNSTYMVASFQ